MFRFIKDALNITKKTVDANVADEVIGRIEKNFGKIVWNKEGLPKNGKWVLCRISYTTHFPTVVVGRAEHYYDPYNFQIYGMTSRQRVIEWCDCLPENFYLP